MICWVTAGDSPNIAHCRHTVLELGTFESKNRQHNFVYLLHYKYLDMVEDREGERDDA